MIYTVRGPIEKKDLGMTLSHEHIKWEEDENVANTMYFDKVYREEIIENDLAVIMPILKDLKVKGVKGIVETSPPIGGQNVKLLKRLSDQADMHFIPCTGWNITKQIYDLLPVAFEEQMAKRWIDDFKMGLDMIDGVVIRPGFIKLLLDRGTLSSADRAMLISAIMASRETGMPIHCHILEAKMALDVFDLIACEGLAPSKFLWAHADEESNLEVIRKGLDLGIWIGIDNIRQGTHVEKYALLKSVIDMGFGHRVLLSQDYDFYKEAIKDNASHPCTVIIDEFMKYCSENAIGEEILIAMLTENPAAFYDI